MVHFLRGKLHWQGLKAHSAGKIDGLDWLGQREWSETICSIGPCAYILCEKRRRVQGGQEARSDRPVSGIHPVSLAALQMSEMELDDSGVSAPSQILHGLQGILPPDYIVPLATIFDLPDDSVHGPPWLVRRSPVHCNFRVEGRCPPRLSNSPRRGWRRDNRRFGSGDAGVTVYAMVS